MRVLFATAEFAPVARVGGLGAAAAGLVAELHRQGVEVDVVLPDYGGLELSGEIITELAVPDWVGPTSVRRGIHAQAGRLTLVTVPGMARPHPYVQADGQGWIDNIDRFMGFSAAVAAWAQYTQPDVVHLNDWHTAATIGLMADHRPIVLTVHTLGYQGHADRSWLRQLTRGAEFFDRHGAFNPLAGGITLADRVVAVSPSYAAEIVTPEGGAGLDDLLIAKGSALVGILNGIDAEIWDPRIDQHLPATFGSATANATAGKARNKATVRNELGLPDSVSPLLVVVTRLVDQKGIDLLLPLVDCLERLPAQLVVLGDGDRWLVEALSAASARYPDHLAFRSGYDESLAHRLFGAADLFVMPSRFEPCGLAQMQAMRYGALPIVTAVGGLRDTVIDLDSDTENGTGIVAVDVSAPALVDAVHRGVRVWNSVRKRQAAQRRGMQHDWSWSEPARQHIELYHDVRGGML